MVLVTAYYIKIFALEKLFITTIPALGLSTEQLSRLFLLVILRNRHLDNILYFSKKQLLRKMKSRLVIIECAGYIFRQLFLRQLYFICLTCSQFRNFAIYMILVIVLKRCK